MFSLEDRNTLKAHIIAISLLKKFDTVERRQLAHHIVIARNEAEAFGILFLAYNEKDPLVEFEMWSIFADMTGEAMREEIDFNNRDLAETLIGFDKP